MCNCQDEIRKSIIEDWNAKSVVFELNNIINTALTEDKRVKKTAQRVYIYRNQKLKNGTFKEIKQSSFIAHVYCPWCGEKYEK